MEQITTIDEEKKKREAAASATGGMVVAPQTNITAGSRPPIYDGQPETATAYGNAARALVGSLPPVFNAEERIGPSTKPSVVGQMVSNVIAGERSKLKALNQYDDLPKASYSNEGRVAQRPVTAAAPSAVAAIAAPPEQPAAAPEKPEAPQAEPTPVNQAVAIQPPTASAESSGPTGYVIPDQNKADREALFAKWDREAMFNKLANMNPRNAAAVAHLVGQGFQADNTKRGQDFQREAQAGNLSVAKQDATTRERAAASIAGLQSSQSQGIMADVDTKANMVALQNRAASGDKQAIDALRAMRGQGRDANFKGLHAAGGSSIDPSTGQVVKSPDNVVIYNEQTGQIQQLGAGGQGAAGKAPVVGEVRGGFKFKGGNPADKAAWEKV